MKVSMSFNPASRTATPTNSDRNNGAATGKRRHSTVQLITAKASFAPLLIGAAFRTGIGIWRRRFGTRARIR